MQLSEKVHNLKYYNPSGYIGTSVYHKVGLGNLVVTDGVKKVCEDLQCYWITDIIASYLPKLRKKYNSEYMFSVRVVPVDGGADFCIDDGDGNVCIGQHIPFTDLKKNILFYLGYQGSTDNRFVACLPSED